MQEQILIKNSMQNPITIKISQIHERGVFATTDIKKDEIIEMCPVIVISREDRLVLEKTIIDEYAYQWGEDSSGCAIALGNGSLYNHSYEPNAIYEKNFNAKTLIIRAYKDIKEGAEIFINYNMNPNDKSLLWFNI